MCATRTYVRINRVFPEAWAPRATYSTSGAKLREAEFRGGGGPWGNVNLKVGDPVSGSRLHGDETYYVPRENLVTRTSPSRAPAEAATSWRRSAAGGAIGC